MNEKNFKRKIENALREAQKDIKKKRVLDPIGEGLADEIKKRTRLGYGVDRNGGRQQKLKPLKDSTRKSRAYMKRKGKLHPDTSPAKSNLTMTGEMTDSITNKARDGKITLEVGTKYAIYHQDGDRPFMHLTSDQVRGQEKKLRDLLKRLIQRKMR